MNKKFDTLYHIDNGMWPTDHVTKSTNHIKGLRALLPDLRFLANVGVHCIYLVFFTTNRILRESESLCSNMRRVPLNILLSSWKIKTTKMQWLPLLDKMSLTQRNYFNLTYCVSYFYPTMLKLPLSLFFCCCIIPMVVVTDSEIFLSIFIIEQHGCNI